MKITQVTSFLQDYDALHNQERMDTEPVTVPTEESVYSPPGGNPVSSSFEDISDEEEVYSPRNRVINYDHSYNSYSDISSDEELNNTTPLPIASTPLSDQLRESKCMPWSPAVSPITGSPNSNVLETSNEQSNEEEDSDVEFLVQVPVSEHTRKQVELAKKKAAIHSLKFQIEQLNKKLAEIQEDNQVLQSMLISYEKSSLYGNEELIQNREFALTLVNNFLEEKKQLEVTFNNLQKSYQDMIDKCSELNARNEDLTNAIYDGQKEIARLNSEVKEAENLAEFEKSMAFKVRQEIRRLESSNNDLHKSVSILMKKEKETYEKAAQLWDELDDEKDENESLRSQIVNQTELQARIELLSAEGEQSRRTIVEMESKLQEQDGLIALLYAQMETTKYISMSNILRCMTEHQNSTNALLEIANSTTAAVGNCQSCRAQAMVNWTSYHHQPPPPPEV